MDSTTAITRAEHEEFRKRLDVENRRQDRRIELLEENTKQIGSLTTSVEKLAQSTQMMVKEQEKQGRRLAELEGRDRHMWRKLIGYPATPNIGLMIGNIFTQIRI